MSCETSLPAPFRNADTTNGPLTHEQRNEKNDDDNHDDDNDNSTWYVEAGNDKDRAGQPPQPHAGGDGANKGSSSNNKNQKNNIVIIVPEQKGNAIHLHTAIRKYTGATLTAALNETTRQRRHVVRIELSKLYDALGLLRSLQYDVKSYNTQPGTKYSRFRLTRQAAAFGVRLTPRAPPPVDDDGIVVPGLDSLVAYIETAYADSIASARANVAGGMVDFDSLSEYYVPGRTVLDRGISTGIAHVAPALLKVRASYYARGKTLTMGTVSSFHIALETVVAAEDDFYAVVEFQHLQSHFHGTRSIAGAGSVDTFAIPSDKLIADLTIRGRHYQMVCGTMKDLPPTTTTATGSGRMVQYSAGSFLSVGGGKNNNKSSGGGNGAAMSRSGGRMMVDTVTAWGRGVNCAVHNGTASDTIVSCLKIYQQTRAQQQQQQQRQPAGGSPLEYSTAAAAADDGDGLHDLLVLPGPLPDELAPLTWPVVAGFSFAVRAWGVALVHNLSEIRYDDTIFDAVVLPPERKKLIKALVASHSSTGEYKSADLISGKGEGSIFLLYGPPGVGKTLTAEAIAEMLHKPLYVVSMGELGTSPEALENRLQDILDLCVPWQALVLIDEAEMLLERRSKNDIVRNAMVCVMLRLLEYYSGILFLTTNRVESLDPAFQSRVTCALRYEPLTVEARTQIWQTMLQRLDIDATNIDVTELASADINGRQIKNTLQLATALARHDNVPVHQVHLRETLAVTTSFLRETTASTNNDNNRREPEMCGVEL